MSQSFKQDKLVVSDLSALSDRRLTRCAARFSTRLNLVPSIVSLLLSRSLSQHSTVRQPLIVNKKKVFNGLCEEVWQCVRVVSWLKVWQWGAASNFSLSLELCAVELILLKLCHCIDTSVKKTNQYQLCYRFNLCFWNNGNVSSGNFVLWRCLNHINWKSLDT